MGFLGVNWCYQSFIIDVCTSFYLMVTFFYDIMFNGFDRNTGSKSNDWTVFRRCIQKKVQFVPRKSFGKDYTSHPQMIKRYLCTQNLEIMLPLPPHLTTLHGLSFNALSLPFLSFLFFSFFSCLQSVSFFSLPISLFWLSCQQLEESFSFLWCFLFYD